MAQDYQTASIDEPRQVHKTRELPVESQTACASTVNLLNFRIGCDSRKLIILHFRLLFTVLEPDNDQGARLPVLIGAARSLAG